MRVPRFRVLRILVPARGVRRSSMRVPRSSAECFSLMARSFGRKFFFCLRTSSLLLTNIRLSSAEGICLHCSPGYRVHWPDTELAHFLFCYFRRQTDKKGIKKPVGIIKTRSTNVLPTKYRTQKLFVGNSGACCLRALLGKSMEPNN